MLGDDKEAELKNRSDYGVPEDKFVFCYFGPLANITPAVFDVWCAILKRVRLRSLLKPNAWPSLAAAA